MSSTTTSIGSSFRNSLCSFLAIVLKVNGIWVVGSPVQFFILPRLLRKTFVSYKAHLLLKVLFLLLLHKSSNMHPMDLLFDPFSVSKHFSLVFPFLLDVLTFAGVAKFTIFAIAATIWFKIEIRQRVSSHDDLLASCNATLANHVFIKAANWRLKLAVHATVFSPYFCLLFINRCCNLF